MILFLKNTFIFFLVTLFVSVVPFIVYMHVTGLSSSELPALKITNSFSYNEKALFLRNKQADILTIGSSVSLNDIHSLSITNYSKSNSYLNLSSWGLSVRDIFELLKTYSSIHKPNKLIIASSVFDFTNNDKVIDYKDLRVYLTSSGYNSLFFKYFNLFYSLSEMSQKKEGKDESFHNTRTTLINDSFGAVLIRKDAMTIHRLEENLAKDVGLMDIFVDNKVSKLYEYNFNYLDSISIYCRVNKIQLYFFQSAIRGKLYEGLKQNVINKLNTHIDRERMILLRNNHHFVDCTDRVWNDSLFVDSYHLNAIGAPIFTTYCLGKSTFN